MDWIEMADGPGNDYGSLHIGTKDGRFYWAVENYSGLHPQEIPEHVYVCLLQLHNERLVETPAPAGNPPAEAGNP